MKTTPERARRIHKCSHLTCSLLKYRYLLVAVIHYSGLANSPYSAGWYLVLLSIFLSPGKSIISPTFQCMHMRTVAVRHHMIIIWSCTVARHETASQRAMDRARVRKVQLEDQECLDETPGTSKRAKISRKYAGSFYFEESWCVEYPVEAVSAERSQFRCIPYQQTLSCAHQGKYDVTYHCNTKKELVHW